MAEFDAEQHEAMVGDGWSERARMHGGENHKASPECDDCLLVLDPKEWALRYARTYWMRGNEPKSQAALTILARLVQSVEPGGPQS